MMNLFFTRPATRPVLRTLMVLLTLTLCQARCGSDKKDPVPHDPHSKEITGKWFWENLLIAPPVDNIDDILEYYHQIESMTGNCHTVFEYDFKRDGSLVPLHGKVCVEGIVPLQLGPQTGDTWSVNGKKIIITHANGSKDEADFELQDQTLNGLKYKLMIWRRTVGGQSYTWQFTRRK